MTSTRCPGLRSILIGRLLLALSNDLGVKLAFQKKLSAYFRGELPHCKEVITSTLLHLLDESTIPTTYYEPGDRYNTIPKVSRRWPGRTKEALRVSLDNGIFYDFLITPGPAATTQRVYLSTAVTDEGVSSLFWRCTSLNSCESLRWLTSSQSSVPAGRRPHAKSLSFNVGVKFSYAFRLFSHRLVGRLLCTTRTPTASFLSHLGQKTLSCPFGGLPRILSSEDTRVR